MLRYITDIITNCHTDLTIEPDTRIFPRSERPLETRNGEFGHSAHVCFRGRYSVAHHDFYNPIERAVKRERYHINIKEFVQIAPEVYAFEIREMDEDDELLYYIVVSRKRVETAKSRHSLTVITVSYKLLS